MPQSISSGEMLWTERLPKSACRQTGVAALSIDHAELELRFLGHHAGVPGRIPDQLDLHVAGGRVRHPRLKIESGCRP